MRSAVSVGTDPRFWSENFGASAGVASNRMAIDLAGFEEQSTWGWDEMSGSFYAQLWRNDNRGDNPDLWLSGVQPIAHAEQLVEPLASFADRTPLDVVRALGIAHPSPQLQTAEHVAEQWRQAYARSGDDYTNGLCTGYAWVITDGPRSPSSDQWIPGTPLAPVVHAEAAHATGVVYSSVNGRSQSFNVGVEEALLNSLR